VTGDPIPEADNITRWCGGSHVDPETGSIGPGAFMLRAKDTDRLLSVNWLEYFKPLNRESQVDEVRKVLTKKMSRVGPNSRLAVLNVKHVISSVQDATGDNASISILHAPVSLEGQWDDPSHSGIYGLKIDDDISPVALSQIIIEIYPAKTT
jgi:hypothetical protein